MNLFRLFLVVYLFASTAVQAKVWYVKTNGSGSGNSWSDAASNIQSVINNANNGDDIYVAEGTYNLNAALNWNKRVDI